MTRITNRSWTPDAVEQLKQLVASNTSRARAAVILKRSMESVQAQARKVGMPFPSIRKRAVPPNE